MMLDGKEETFLGESVVILDLSCSDPFIFVFDISVRELQTCRFDFNGPSWP